MSASAPRLGLHVGVRVGAPALAPDGDGDDRQRGAHDQQAGRLAVGGDAEHDPCQRDEAERAALPRQARALACDAGRSLR